MLMSTPPPNNLQAIDDYKIHCFKEGNPCVEGAKARESQLQILTEPHKDPFEDIDDLDVQDATPAIMLVDEGSGSEDIDII